MSLFGVLFENHVHSLDGNTDTPTERTGAVIIGVIIECVTKKALSLTTDQGSHWNRILLIAFAETVS